MVEVQCVVWDLDDTLREGTLLEDYSVVLKDGILDIIKTLDERGILMSIASKNNFEHAMGIIKQMDIEEYFLYPQINWVTTTTFPKKLIQFFPPICITFFLVYCNKKNSR